MLFSLISLFMFSELKNSPMCLHHRSHFFMFFSGSVFSQAIRPLHLIVSFPVFPIMYAFFSPPLLPFRSIALHPRGLIHFIQITTNLNAFNCNDYPNRINCFNSKAYLPKWPPSFKGSCNGFKGADSELTDWQYDRKLSEMVSNGVSESKDLIFF